MTKKGDKIKESDVRAEVFGLLRRMWLWPFTQTDLFVCRMCGTMNHPPLGRADIITDRHVAVEVKMFKPGKNGDVERSRFFPSQLTPQQRVWLTNYDEDADVDRYTNEPDMEGAYLALGTKGVVGQNRCLFIVPWFKYLQLEEEIASVIGSGKALPLQVYAGMHNKDQYDLEGFTAKEALDRYAAEWYNGSWRLPYRHPLMQLMLEWRDSFELRDLKEESARWPASQKRR